MTTRGALERGAPEGGAPGPKSHGPALVGSSRVAAIRPRAESARPVLACPSGRPIHSRPARRRGPQARAAKSGQAAAPSRRRWAGAQIGVGGPAGPQPESVGLDAARRARTVLISGPPGRGIASGAGYAAGRARRAGVEHSLRPPAESSDG